MKPLASCQCPLLAVRGVLSSVPLCCPAFTWSWLTIVETIAVLLWSVLWCSPTVPSLVHLLVCLDNHLCVSLRHASVFEDPSQIAGYMDSFLFNQCWSWHKFNQDGLNWFELPNSQSLNSVPNKRIDYCIIFGCRCTCKSLFIIISAFSFFILPTPQKKRCLETCYDTEISQDIWMIYNRENQFCCVLLQIHKAL